MKAHIVQRAGARPAELAGMILTRDVRGPTGERTFAKGHVVLDDDVPALLALDWSTLHVIEAEPGEIHEDEAGRRIAAAIAGEGTSVGAMSGGHCPITATRRGILHVDVERLDCVNAIDGACAYTLYDGQIIDAGEVVARAKITPFVLDESRVEAAERTARGATGVVRVAAFQPMTVAAIVQETLGDRAMARFREVLGEKVAWFGSRLLDPLFVPPNDADIARALDAAAHKAQVIVVAGTKAMDPLDPVFVALDRLGVRLERFGAPAHPGSLFWIARSNDVPVLGMPSCGLFSQATVFDLVLPRILAGEQVGRAELAALGHGGLITRDVAFRFPRYREAKGRGEIE